MEKIKVTVAIPVYNAGKSLNVTLDSLMHQTMNSEDFEIICVNDCSTDNSKEIIEEYGKMMKNIILIDRSENSGGPSSPRNDAINAARGEYIHFMDSDDFLGEEALERLYKSAKENGSDVIFGRHVPVNGRHLFLRMYWKGNRLNADIIKDNLIYTLAPHKMFRLAFLKENGFNFHPEVKTANEDQLFVMQCYVAASVITLLDDYDYYFVVARGNENISAKYYPAGESFFVPHKLMEFLNNFIQDEHYKKRIKVAFLNRFFQNSLRPYLFTSRSTREQKIEWLSETKKFIDTHIDDELIQSFEPSIRNFLEVAKENHINKLAKVPF